MIDAEKTYDVAVKFYAREGGILPDKSMKKRRRRKIYEIIAAMCEISSDVVGKIPVFVLRGKHEMEVTGCVGVREYTEEKIILSIGKELFTVSGDSLELTDFREDVLYIRGNIAAMYFGTEDESSC